MNSIAYEMRNYNLGFISDENIYNHVRETVTRYSASINLREFNKNIVDPIKLTFDAKVYGRTMEEVVASECIRQMDKSNNNHIGYFHQNLFRYAGNGWTVPPEGFDVVNEEQHIYACLLDNPKSLTKKKMNSLMIRCFDKQIHDKGAVCYIVNMNDHSGKDEIWKADNIEDNFSSKDIRLVSIDRFYEIVFNDKTAYQRICDVLPLILDDIN